MNLQALLPGVEETLWAARDHGGKVVQEIGAFGRVVLEQVGMWEIVANKTADLWKGAHPKVHEAANLCKWVFEMTREESLAAEIRQEILHTDTRLARDMASDGNVAFRERPRWKGEDVKKCALRALAVGASLWVACSICRWKMC